MIPECRDANKCDSFNMYRKEFSNDVLLNECDFLETILHDLGLPLVLSHNDIHHGNLVLNEDDKQVTILDYELMAMNYEHHDIAFLMMAWEILGSLGKAGPDAPPLTDEIREAYVKSYLHAKYESNNHNPLAVFDKKHVRLATVAVRILETVACLRYIATGMLFINIGGEIDQLPTIAHAKDVYADSKRNIKSLRDKYQQLKAELKVNRYWWMGTGSCVWIKTCCFKG